MKRKTIYHTKQMEILLSYLKTVQGKHVTVQEIGAALKDNDISVGTTTIYRHLEKLVNEGKIAKYQVDGTSSACFEYLGDGEKCHHPVCFHCKCVSCGDLIHMECDQLSSLGSHLSREHGFELDSGRTVFYGICKKCKGKKNEYEI